MKLEEIKHTATLKSLKSYPEINVEDYDNINDLRKRILFLRKQIYRKSHAEYFRTYMRNKYRKEHPPSKE